MIKKICAAVFLLFFATAGLKAAPVYAAASVEIGGDTKIGPLVADADGKYKFVNVPLRRNSVNRFTVTAKDGNQTQSREVLITQVSLDSVVVSKIKAEPLSVQEIEQLVNDGVIQLDDPANFHVSKFEIVLTIGRREYPISLPLVRAIEEPMGSEEIPPQSDPGNGNGNPPPPPPQIIVFEVQPPSSPGEPPPPPIPGVLIIEGRIKTLKEFYSVRLLLMNTSGIFTLHDVSANIEFPDGGLSWTLPSDGGVEFGDILPGDADTPGQKEREFIIRGDEIGIRGVKVNFGGKLIGPGIPEDSPIPFNGSAATTVEVKGPPEFRVQVIHPPSVAAGIPYELLVDITNVSETPALYTSFELDVGGDGEIVECTYDEATSQPLCEPIDGSAVRNIGHLLPGQKTRQSFMINPFVSGDITSCMSVSDQNIDLQVLVGAIGCLSGKRPPAKAVADGVPTVSVLPIPNSFGLGVDTPVTAFFNEVMNTSSISTGSGGTFNVFDDVGDLVPGQLRFVTIADHTVAIWQPSLGPLKGNTTFTVSLSQTVSDLQGFNLDSAWVSEFTTTDPNHDITPPTLTLAIEPPVIPHNVIPGQIIQLNAYAADQGTGVARVELRMQDTNVPGSAFVLIDQKTVFKEVSEPVLFAVDSSKLIAGHTYQFMATAFDRVGNSQDATIPAIIALSAAAPTIELQADPAQPVLQGVSVSVMPVTISPTVKTVDYFLDAQAAPYKTVTVSPFSATLGTLNVPLGTHTIKAVASDALGQTGEDTFVFTLVQNPSEPVVNFGSSVDGAQYVVGTPVSVNGEAVDPVGISNVAFFLDNPAGPAVATSTEPFVINTSSLSPGTHQLFFKATNKLGVSNNLSDPASILEFDILPVPPPAPPPAAPVVTEISYPVNGQVTVKGTSAAGARIDVTNVTGGFQTSVFANASGIFQLLVSAAQGDLLRLTALNLAQSPTPSSPTDVVVPNPPVLDHISVSPVSRTFTALNQFQDIVVTGHYVGGATDNLTGQAVFSSNNSGTASVSSLGRVVPQANGAAVVTVTAGGKQATVPITVDIVTLTGIIINPPDFKLIGLDKTRTIEVLGQYSNGTTSPLSLANVVLSSSNLNVATIGAAGIVTSKAFGTATISATVSGFPAAYSLVTVEDILPVDIHISPNTILFTSAGETRQLDVTVDLNDGSTRAPIGEVLYFSDNTSVATVDADGLVTAEANGDATISVTHASFTKTVTVVTDIPSSVIPPPEILLVDRPTAGEGDRFVIRGNYFAATPNANKVLVNGIQAVVESSRQDELVVIVPKGAATGQVTVEVNAKVSNTFPLAIYPRTSLSSQVTPAVDMPASAGAKLNLPGPIVDFRAGDKVYLSSAPDILAPLSFSGVLKIKVDSSSFFPVSPTAPASDVSSLLSAGEHTLTLELSEAGGKFVTAPIYVLAGPPSTGAIAGIHTVMANAQSRPTAVTFTNLKDSVGNSLPDGAKVVVTASQVCFRDPLTGNCINSHGGTILNGVDSPDGLGLRSFTVMGGRVDVVYEPGTAPPLRSKTSATATVQVLPANASGHRTSDYIVAMTPVTLTSFDTVGTSRSQSSAVADGFEKVVLIKFLDPRDTAGQRVPDGTPVLASTVQTCFRDAVTGNCISSAGGNILSGEDSPDGLGLRKHLVTGGAVELQYSPGSISLAYPETAISNIQWIPSKPNGSRIDSYAFQTTPVTLSSATSQSVIGPATVFADTGDNRSVFTFSGFKDVLGNPVPDGTKVVVTAVQTCFRDPVTNNCIASAGGVIISGTDSPDGLGLKVHEIIGGQTQVTYSTLGLGMQSRQSALVTVQMLPARPNGSRIGDRALAIAPVTATGYYSAAVSANPAAVVADGLSKTVTITLSNIRDSAGNVVPDGTVVLLTAVQTCFRDAATGNCIASAGGVITSGVFSPDGVGLKAHVVSGGQVVAHYDPSSVLLAFPDVTVANVQVLPGKPASNSRIGDYAFAIVPVSLSSFQQASVSIVPPSVVANTGPNHTVVTLTNIKDGAGNTVPDGTKIVATATASCFRDPVTNNCIGSAGGTIVSGTPSPDGIGLQVHTVSGGSTAITYSASPVGVESRDAAIANVQIFPSQPNGSRIGNRAVIVAPVTLAGYQTADVSGPGQLVPGGIGTYIISNIRDTSGNLIPDGAKILVTATASCFRDPETGNCIGSSGGTVTNGVPSPDGFNLKSFTISSGQISVNFQAPASPGTSVLQFFPGRPNDTRIGNKVFVLKSISVQSGVDI